MSRASMITELCANSRYSPSTASQGSRFACASEQCCFCSLYFCYLGRAVLPQQQPVQFSAGTTVVITSIFAALDHSRVCLVFKFNVQPVSHFSRAVKIIRFTVQSAPQRVCTVHLFLERPCVFLSMLVYIPRCANNFKGPFHLATNDPFGST